MSETTSACHTQAMDTAMTADIARLQGDNGRSRIEFKKALRLEKQAISAMGDCRAEPTYSVLHRSAAWLAVSCRGL